MSTTYGSELCFFCAKSTPKEKITWDQQRDYVKDPEGVGAIRIHLCPLCASSLGIRLIRDGLRITPKKMREIIKSQIAANLEYELKPAP